MNENGVKNGLYTTEFWITAISNIAGAILMVLVGRGLISDEESALWLELANAIAFMVIPIVLAIVNKQYINSRTMVKLAASESQ